MARKLPGSAIQSGTITSTQFSIELGPVTSELQLVGSGVSLNVSNNAVFSGNVGIGTTSPTQKLHVSGKIRANEFVGSNTSYYLIPDSTSYLRSAYFTQSDTTNGYVQIGENYVYGVDNATGGSFELRNNGNSFITGNVGIGTTSPTFKLHVVNGKLGINGGGNGSLLSIGGYTPKAWDFAQTIELGNKVASISGEDGISTIHVGTNAYFDGSNWRYATSDSVALYDQYYGEHRFYTASSGTSGNVISWAQSVTITESGSVGIATTSPTQKLHVNGLVRANEFVGSNASWYLIPDDTSYLKEAYWTTNPASGTYLYTYPTYLQAVNSSTGRTFVFDTGTGNSYINLGNIGIGTTSPTQKLHVFGNVRIGSVATNFNPSSGSGYNLVLDGSDYSSIGFHDSGATYASIKFSNNNGFEIGAADGTYGPHPVLLHAVLENQGKIWSGSPASYSAGGSTVQTAFDEIYALYGFKDLGVISTRAFHDYQDFKTNITSDNVMFMFKFIGYQYNGGVSYYYCGGYTYTTNSVISKATGTGYRVLGGDHVYDVYRASDGALCVKLYIGNQGYNEGETHVMFNAFDRSTNKNAAIVASAVYNSTSPYYT